jgi:hypothetical protein
MSERGPDVQGAGSEHEHVGFANPVDGGWAGYCGACHTCDWTGPTYAQKGPAQADAAVHEALANGVQEFERWRGAA